MNTSAGIAIVTKTLSQLLQNGIKNGLPPLADAHVTTLSLDKARPDKSTNRLNLFLYHIVVNPGLRNMDPFPQVRTGEVSYPPLALNLYYLLTAYADENAGENAGETTAHELLGEAMSILHDHPLLDPADLKAPDGNGWDQIERVRVTWQPLSLEDVSKLWAGFQAQYRLSVAYEVGVVLIDSARSARAALPVLRRGAADRGPLVLASMPYPTLDEVRLVAGPPPGRGQREVAVPAARPGDSLILVGRSLAGTAMQVRLTSEYLKDAILLPPGETVATGTLAVQVPDPADAWAPGLYRVAVVNTPTSVEGPAAGGAAPVPAAVDASDFAWVTNALSFGLAPIVSKVRLNPAAGGNPLQTLTVAFRPQIRSGQRAQLLFGGTPAAEMTAAADTGELSFPLANPASGEHVVRLRIDGVDSLPYDPLTTPLAFDPQQKVKIP